MAVMDALLKIKADVQGDGKIGALGKSLGGLQKTAGTVGGAFKQLTGSFGGLGGAISSLLPALSVAGLATMAKGAIDTADSLAKMSNQTGVSVENLSKFKQAADLGGTSIEAVSGAMLKLNKSLATGTGPAAGALKELGISATDAEGKLRGTDEIMLDVADKFKAMPDGARKSALAMALFGKSGAELIPMLNGGRESIEGLTASMSTSFAKASEAFNDQITKIQERLFQLAVKVGEVVMPMFVGLTDVVGGVVEAIAALPGPVQGLIVATTALVVMLPAIVKLVTALVAVKTAFAGMAIGATIAGWLGALGPAIVAAKAVLLGLVGWLTSTLLPGLLAVFSGPVGWTVLAVAAVVAMAIAFREPIMKFLSWFGDALVTAGKAIGSFLYQWFVQPWVDVWELVKGPVTAYFEWVKGVFTWGLKAWYAIMYKLLVQPFVNIWNTFLREPVTKFIGWVGSVWGNISKGFNKYVTEPIVKAWNAMLKVLPNAMSTAVKFVQNVWTGMINTIRNALRGFLTNIAKNINVVANNINRLINAFNQLPGPKIPLVPTITVPAFATGGFVKRATLGLIGEAGPEYIIPENKMAAASSRYLSGARGAEVLSTGTATVSPSATGDVTINVKTGPVMEFDGQRYVKLEELDRAMRITAEGVIGRLRTPAARRALGVT